MTEVMSMGGEIMPTPIVAEEFEKENKDSEKNKKRNSRKRNRCDMTPEELQRLRERERKAQQSRRDRIRAQKLLQQKNERALPAVPATMVNMGSDVTAVNDYPTSENSVPALMKIHASNSASSLDIMERGSSKSDEVYHEPIIHARDNDSLSKERATHKNEKASPNFEMNRESPERQYHRHTTERHHDISPSYLPVSASSMFDNHHLIPRSYTAHRYLDEGRYLADLHYHRIHRHSGYKESPSNKHMYYHTVDEKKSTPVTRNIDRKNLSEEELENLRRRERDYQRERRARIRLEKTKHSIDDEVYFKHLHRDTYRHSEDYYRPKYYDYHRPLYSPPSPPLSYRRVDKYGNRELFRENEIYGASKYMNRNTDVPHNMKPRIDDDLERAENELLQVVPKNRHYEDMKMSSPEFHVKANTSPLNMEGKGLTSLENICTTLKKETNAPKKITEDQLERRRKSNREAQRRRRARLKMIEERPSSALDNSSESVASDGVSMNSSCEEERFGKKSRLQKNPSNRPDSLYPEDFAYYPNDKYFSPLMKEIKSKKYTYDLKHQNENGYAHHYRNNQKYLLPDHCNYEKEKLLLERERMELKAEEMANTVIVKPIDEGKTRKRKQFVPRKINKEREEEIEEDRLSLDYMQEEKVSEFEEFEERCAMNDMPTFTNDIAESEFSDKRENQNGSADSGDELHIDVESKDDVADEIRKEYF